MLDTSLNNRTTVPTIRSDDRIFGRCFIGIVFLISKASPRQDYWVYRPSLRHHRMPDQHGGISLAPSGILSDCPDIKVVSIFVSNFQSQHSNCSILTLILIRIDAGFTCRNETTLFHYSTRSWIIHEVTTDE